MSNDTIDQTVRLRAEEQPFVIATVVAYKRPQSARPGSKAIIKPDGSIDGWVGGGCVQPIVIREAQKALQTGRPKLISISPESAHGDWKGVESYDMSCQGGGSLEIFLEPVLPKPELLIVGNSPVAQILAGLGKLLDFRVCVADPDANATRFPEADLVLTDLKSARGRIGSGSYVVVATMGTGDEEGLEAVVGTHSKYTGLVASKEKARGLFEYLRGKGVVPEALADVKCPAGLELGAETLPEIALSVMADITRLRRSASQQGEPVKETMGASRRVASTTTTTTETSTASSAASHHARPSSEKIKGGPLPTVQRITTTSTESWSESSTEARDPVCGMMVNTASSRYTSAFRNKTVYFCCLRCKESFDRSPENHVT
ncbi:MAG TPA: XdhC family protein [Blastocatellia bacterium]|nr:XdhC family protein [Blastocatellia bacterium]